uniref:Ubiquitin carboxyl-terminal hydrolase 47 n=1 Tax=Percolomonas cosmopolitus TaxID=63605 RepID=A0A7S1KS34_9EUKA|mmetsp:Transcript_6328/g.23849  ORF Transcript_6328/g.23849 Transcript_6328/m.23849 type:complete len:1258 (+) Transcript_6328:201-3974(+)|eukprot:CAMPEP_0117437624 /NCGR_PEP_ID=MMETSP0759-20121206/1626_1 /TAXON_ID=63605 /ORGANISM="Percolomonas cosmopolitus, Strain WS" /LENGTH=1257 /DNA_ID=CAMNT_0005229275 /DNA_START=158 /DNA_END=3931 /DNA_ORIENTATION=+
MPIANSDPSTSSNVEISSSDTITPKQQELAFSNAEINENATSAAPQLSGEVVNDDDVSGKQSTSGVSPKPAAHQDEKTNDSPPERNFVGLSNQGATCYLNSLIQSLYMTPEIRNALYKWRYNEELHGSAERSIPYQLQRLFVLLEKSTRRSVQTEDLTKSFGWTTRDAFVQHDINELCRVLFVALDKTFAPNLYRMREELSKTDNDNERDQIRKRYENDLESEYLMSDLYAGTMIDYIHAKDHFAPNGKPIGREREDKFLDLQLVVHNIGSLEESLRNYIKPEYLTGENKWRCDDLDATVDATKGFRFENFPSILTLHLKRFDYDRRTWQPVKLSHRIEFPFELDLKGYVPENYSQETRYELFSCLIHSGSVRSGHYYAYIKNMANNKWYEFNDSNVREISIEDVQKMYGRDEDISSYSSTNAYMLMYRRVDSMRDNNTVFHSEFIPEDLQQWVSDLNEKWEEDRQREELRRNTLTFRVHFSDHPDLRRGRISSVDIQMLNHHTLKELKLEAVKRFAQIEKRALEHRHNTRDDDNDGSEQDDKESTLWNRPEECYRIRYLERHYRMEVGKIFTEEDTILKRNFRYDASLLLQMRNEGDEWPRDQRSISVYVYFLDTVKMEFEKQITMDFDCSFTVRELREFLASKINFRGETFPPGRVGLLKKCSPFQVIDLLDEQNMDRFIEDVGLENYDDIYVEILPEEGAPCKSRRLLELQEYYYVVFVNHPGTDDYRIRYEALKTETLADMKRNISILIDIPITEFRMSLLGNDGQAESPFEGEHRKLNVVPRIWNNTKIHVERGKVLAPGEFSVNIFRYITEKEYFQRLELERKKKRARQLKKEMDDKRALKKQEEQSDEMRDDQSGASEDAQDAAAHPPATGPEAATDTSASEDTQQAAVPSSKGIPLAPVLPSQDVLLNPQLGINPPRQIPPPFTAEKIKPHVLGCSERNNLFRLVTKMIVSNSMQVSEFKELIAKALLPKEFAPENIRVRVKNSNTVDKVLAPNEERLKMLVPKLGSSTEFAFQVFNAPDTLPARPMIINIRQWFSASWTFGAASEMVLNTESVRTSEDFKKTLAPLVDIPEEHLAVYKAPYNLEYLPKRDCSEIAILDWKYETNNIFSSPFRLEHGETMLFRDMRHEEKQDPEKLKKKYQYSGWNSGLSSSSWNNSSSRKYEPEQQLRITTEFDEPITPTPNGEDVASPSGENGEGRIYPMVAVDDHDDENKENKTEENAASGEQETKRDEADPTVPEQDSSEKDKNE